MITRRTPGSTGAVSAKESSLRHQLWRVGSLNGRSTFSPTGSGHNPWRQLGLEAESVIFAAEFLA
jgi:hypothetical protein